MDGQSNNSKDDKPQYERWCGGNGNEINEFQVADKMSLRVHSSNMVMK